MKIKIKKVNKDGMVRLETSGIIKEILINEDLVNPDSESISICFRGKDSSGIIDMSPQEYEKFYYSVKNRMHLIKGFKNISNGGAIYLGK